MNAQAVRLTEVDIDNALANDHLGVVFQPVFSFADGGLARMEAFVRWDHPGLGSLPPGAFISFFEAQGRMGELTRHVVRRAVRSYKSWRGASGPGCSVNLAQSDLTDEAFAADLTAILSEEAMPPALVTLECPPMPAGVTPEEARALYARLAETGCPLAAEVRGRVPAEIAAADPFPFAEIKTGGAAILRFARTARGGESLDAISELLDLAKRHGAKAVAVGVEDGDAALALKQLGFDAGQGKLLGAAASLDGFSAQSINGARAALGLEALPQDALGKMVERKAEEPLVLTAEAEPAEEAEAPAGEATKTATDETPEEDATALAIARLKARKIAAKRIALRRAEEARRRAEEEEVAARQASETARRLQERLSAQIEGEAAKAASVAADEPPSDDEPPAPPAPPAVAVSAPIEEQAEEAPLAQDGQEDEEAGLLLSDNLAEVALGIAKQPSFADGIRLDGYAPSGPVPHADQDPALMGALAPTQEPGVRDGGAAPVAFSSMASAIHAILEELPVPEGAKPRLMRSATKPLTDTPEEDVSAEDASPADTLDLVVAQAPVLADDTVSAVSEATGSEDEAMLAARLRARPRRKKNVLTRKYRITHFWPRSWVRAVRRWQAARATEDADTGDMVPA